MLYVATYDHSLPTLPALLVGAWLACNASCHPRIELVLPWPHPYQPGVVYRPSAAIRVVLPYDVCLGRTLSYPTSAHNGMSPVQRCHGPTAPPTACPRRTGLA